MQTLRFTLGNKVAQLTVKVPAASEGDSSLAEWDMVTSSLGDDDVAGKSCL